MYAKNNTSFICSFTCPVLVERYVFKHLELRNKDPPSTQLKQLSDTLGPTDALSNTPGNGLLLQCGSSEVQEDQQESGCCGEAVLRLTWPSWEDTDAMLGTH